MHELHVSCLSAAIRCALRVRLARARVQASSQLRSRIAERAHAQTSLAVYHASSLGAPVLLRRSSWEASQSENSKEKASNRKEQESRAGSIGCDGSAVSSIFKSGKACHTLAARLARRFDPESRSRGKRNEPTLAAPTLTLGTVVTEHVGSPHCCSPRSGRPRLRRPLWRAGVRDSGRRLLLDRRRQRHQGRRQRRGRPHELDLAHRKGRFEVRARARRRPRPLKLALQGGSLSGGARFPRSIRFYTSGHSEATRGLMN